MSTSNDTLGVKNTVLFEMSEILVASVAKMLRVKGDIYLSSAPVIREKEIVSFAKRMRVDGLEKFGSRTVFSNVTFHIDKEHLDNGQAVGAMILYIPIDYIAKLMWMLEYGRIDEDEEEVVLDACGTVTNLVAGYFVKELAGHGYVFLEMSHFESYINTSVNGINFSPEQNLKHEVDFYIKDEKKIVAELTMAKLMRY